MRKQVYPNLITWNIKPLHIYLDMSQAKATKVPDGLINTEHGLKYWQNAEASTDGMLGGIPAM